MTQPNPDQSGTDQPAKSKPAKVEVLTVGHYTHHDALLGREHTAVGVVVATGDVLKVRPLAGHYVQVDPSDFTPLSAGDV